MGACGLSKSPSEACKTSVGCVQATCCSAPAMTQPLSAGTSVFLSLYSKTCAQSESRAASSASSRLKTRQTSQSKAALGSHVTLHQRRYKT